MASLKKIGFYCTEEKITIVEFEKNTPLKVVFLPVGSQTGTLSPFSPSLTEEIQTTATFQKMYRTTGLRAGLFMCLCP